MLVAAEAGDADAMRLARPLSAALTKITECGSRRSLACPRPLGREPFAISIIRPYRQDATKAFGAGLCPRCSTAEPKVLLAAGTARFVRSLYPDAQPLGPMHATPERLQ